VEPISFLFEMKFEGDFKKIIAEQQFELVSKLSKDIDNKLSDAQNNLISTALYLPTDNLENHPLTQKNFEKSLAVIF